MEKGKDYYSYKWNREFPEVWKVAGYPQLKEELVENFRTLEGNAEGYRIELQKEKEKNDLQQKRIEFLEEEVRKSKDNKKTTECEILQEQTDYVIV